MFSGGEEKEKPRPRLCPACGTLVGATATKCHSVRREREISAWPPRRRSLGRLLPAESPGDLREFLTITCICVRDHLRPYRAQNGVCRRRAAAGLAALMGLGGISPSVLIVLGGSLPWPGDLHFPVALIMPTLLHGGLLHIGFNMWVLMDIGPQIEELYGSARYLFIYFVTGMGAYLRERIFRRIFSIGASGALLGLIGVMLAITTGRQERGACACCAAV